MGGEETVKFSVEQVKLRRKKAENQNGENGEALSILQSIILGCVMCAIKMIFQR